MARLAGSGTALAVTETASRAMPPTLPEGSREENARVVVAEFAVKPKVNER